MSAGKIVLLVFGIIFILVSFPLLVGGSVMVAIDRSLKDEEGFYSIHGLDVEANSPIIITAPADIHMENLWLWRYSNPVSVKVEAASKSGKDVFIGVARESDLRVYINGASYDEITSFSLYPEKIDQKHFPGNPSLPPPGNQSFWVASSAGSGDHELRWDITTGIFSLVLMNTDGSSPVKADVSVGIKIPPIVSAIGWGLLSGGIVFLIAGGVMLFFAVRRTQ